MEQMQGFVDKGLHLENVCEGASVLHARIATGSISGSDLSEPRGVGAADITLRDGDVGL